MSEVTPPQHRGHSWAPDTMEEDDRMEPGARPSGVRRNLQDTQQVEGEHVLELEEDELIQHPVIQG